MGLSSRELNLILRARDEASRTIGRVAGSLSRLDRMAMRQQMRQTAQSEENLRSMRRHVHDIEGAYQDQTLAARRAYIQGNITAQQYRAAMLDASQLRHDQQTQLRGYRQREEDIIRVTQDRIRQMNEQREHQRQLGHQMVGYGTAAVGAGAALTYFGAMGTAAYVSNIGAAMDYETQVRRTMTQIDTFNAKQEDISDLGKKIADELPVAFEQIQPALYDIFSSIDVGLRGATKLIDQFSRDAVGGTTDLSVATRANLQIMNAFKVETKDATKVSDFMFQLVRKGVGTYDEFAKSIGRAIPSAVRAGQSYHTLGAMMAFMTRNGVSAAMAATSSARALDAISHPATVERLEEMGVNVKNMAGEFRPLPAILGDMDKKFGKLTAPQRAKALQELFKGSGGTIQARRFFDNYFKNADEFNKRSREMADSAGAAKEAFDLMAESPAAKLQQLKNDWMLLRIEIGENLMPAAMAVVEWLNNMLDAFSNLSPEVKKMIEIAGAVILIFGTLIGVLTVIGGAIAIMAGGAAAMGISFGAFIGIGALVAAAFIAIGAGAAWVIKNWDKIKPHIDNIVGVFQDFIGWVQEHFGPTFKKIWDWIVIAFGIAMSQIKKGWQEFKDSIDWEEIKKGFKEVKDTFEKYSPQIKQVLIVLGLFIAAWIMGLGTAIRILLNILGPIFTGIIAAFTGFVTGVIQIIGGMVMVVEGIIDTFAGLFTGDWNRMFSGIARVTQGTWNVIKGIFNVTVGVLLRTVTGLVRGIVNLFKNLSDILVGHSIVPDMVRAIVGWFADMPGMITRALGGLVGAVTRPFNSLKEAATRMVQDLLTSVGNLMGQLPGKITGAIGDLGGLLAGPGRALIQGFIGGVQSLMGVATGLIQSLRNMWDTANAIFAGISGIVSRAGDALGRIQSIASDARSAVEGLNAMNATSAEDLAPFLPDEKSGRSKSIGRGGRNPVKSWIEKLKKELKNVKITKDIKKMYKGVYVQLIQDMATNIPQMNGVLNVARDEISKKLNAMAKGLKGDAAKAFAKNRGKKIKGMLHDVTKATEKDLKRLQKVTKMYQNTLKALDSARSKLQKLRTDQRNLISSVREDLKAFGSLGGLSKPEDVFGNVEDWTAGNIATGLREKLATIKTFGKNLKWILKNYGKKVYMQVLNMGIIDGAEFAAALVKATPAEVGQIKSLVNQIESESSIISNYAGNQMYAAGVKAAEGLVKGLESKAKDLREIAKRLGVLIAQEIKKALKIKSPSQVARDIARNFTGSLADNLRSGERDVKNASSLLARAMVFDPQATFAASPSVVGGPGPTGGPMSQGMPATGGPQITINTAEINPRQHAAELGWELARYNRV